VCPSIAGQPVPVLPWEKGGYIGRQQAGTHTGDMHEMSYLKKYKRVIIC